MDALNLLQGNAVDVLRGIERNSVDMCLTSPPYYGLRDYGSGEEEIGKEATADEYIRKLTDVFSEVKRVLKDDGTLWVNIGDSYTGNNSRASNNGRAGFGNPRETVTNRKIDGYPDKCLIGIPWKLAFSLISSGWTLRQDIIWHKPNPIPESVKDRFTKSHEYIFLLSKNKNYFFDYESVQEEAETTNVFCDEGQLRRKRDVWTIPTKGYDGAHFATFPERLAETCVLAGCPVGGTVLDPFSGAGTTGVVSLKNNRKYIGIELNQNYIDLSMGRIKQETSQTSFSF